MDSVVFGFFAWLALTLVTIRAASVRGRSVMVYFIFCVFFTPVIALIDVLVTTVDETEEENNTIVSVLDEIVNNLESDKIKLDLEDSQTLKNILVKFYKKLISKFTCFVKKI